MISLAITLVAIALGIYMLLLIQIHGLGKWYKAIVIIYLLLAVAYNLCLMARGAMYHQAVHDILTERPYLK